MSEPNGSAAPADRYVSRSLYLLSAAVLVSNVGMGIVWPLVPVYAKVLGATGFQIGMIIASFSVARTFFSPLVGRLSDLYGRKPMLLMGLIAYAALSVFYVMATGVETLFLVRLFHGFSSVLVIPIALALVGDIAPGARLGLFMGTLNMAMLMGMGVGPVLGGFLKDSFGMPVAFYTMGGISVLTFLGTWAFLPPDPQRSASGGKGFWGAFGPLLRNRAVLGLILLRLLFAIGQGTVYTFLPLLGLEIGITSGQVGLILGSNILLIAASQRFFGALADRTNAVHQMLLGMVLSCLAVLFIPLAKGFTMLLALNFLMGLGNGISLPASFVIAGRVGQRLGMGSTMGISETAWALGMIVSPIVAGMVMDEFGLANLFFAGGSLCLGGLAFVLWIFSGYHDA